MRHLGRMLWRPRSFLDFVEPCLPSPADRPPAGPDWIHEIKHDGFRMLARRRSGRVRLFTRNREICSKADRERACSNRVERAACGAIRLAVERQGLSRPSNDLAHS
jgi:ATP-dependent DNA ligase